MHDQHVGSAGLSCDDLLACFTASIVTTTRPPTNTKKTATTRSYLINAWQALWRPSILGKSDDLPIYEMSSNHSTKISLVIKQFFLRTILAPATKACSLARASPPDEAEKPQSQVGYIENPYVLTPTLSQPPYAPALLPLPKGDQRWPLCIFFRGTLRTLLWPSL